MYNNNSDQNNDRDDYYYNNYNYNMNHNPLNPRVSMATAASVIGVVAVGLSLTGYFGLIFGGIAIVLGLLTRSKEGRLLPQAKRAIGFGLVGLIIGIVVIANAVSFVMKPEGRQQLNEYSQQIYGVTFDEMIEEIQSGYSE